MLKKDKNGFIQVIRDSGLKPSQFKSYEKEVDNHPGFILRFVNSPLYFLTRTNCDNYQEHDCRYIKFAPDFPKSEYFPNAEIDKFWEWYPISRVYKHFEEWLVEHVKIYVEEHELPDLWGQINGQELFNGDPLENRNDTTFDQNEKEQIQISIVNFNNFVKVEFNPTDDQQEIISDRLEYLSQAIERLDKVDWMGIAFTTIISISIALGLDTERGNCLFLMFKNTINTGIQFIK